MSKQKFDELPLIVSLADHKDDVDYLKLVLQVIFLLKSLRDYNLITTDDVFNEFLSSSSVNSQLFQHYVDALKVQKGGQDAWDKVLLSTSEFPFVPFQGYLIFLEFLYSQLLL